MEYQQATISVLARVGVSFEVSVGEWLSSKITNRAIGWTQFLKVVGLNASVPSWLLVFRYSQSLAPWASTTMSFILSKPTREAESLQVRRLLCLYNLIMEVTLNTFVICCWLETKYWAISHSSGGDYTREYQEVVLIGATFESALRLPYFLATPYQ